MLNVRSYILIYFFLIPLLSQAQSGIESIMFERTNEGAILLSEPGASHFANLALQCIQLEYPNKLSQVLSDAHDLREPKDLHPGFYGCFDWHSSVHGHWMLIRLMKQFPGLPEFNKIRDAIKINLSKENMEGELEYFIHSSKSWERMYGWSWLLKLAEELYLWDDSIAKDLYTNIEPLANAIAERYISFLPVQDYPVRTGVHPNTAFGLSFAWDYAKSTHHQEMLNLIERRALHYYFKDKDCPCNWEPSGEDFLSPCLEEANLLQRILEPKEFQKWFNQFLGNKRWKHYSNPADVSDRSDPKIVHLDGLNLSRSWCLLRIRSSINNRSLQNWMSDTAFRHINATIPHIASEHYEGSHWLASFAVYALSQQ